MEPTDWVSILAFSHKKAESLRIRLDTNIALKRPHHKIPTIEELSHSFAGAKIFSKLDAKTDYCSIHLDRNSVTNNISVLYERFRFGLSVSQDIFHLKMDQIWGNLMVR